MSVSQLSKSTLWCSLFHVIGLVVFMCHLSLSPSFGPSSSSFLFFDSQVFLPLFVSISLHFSVLSSCYSSCSPLFFLFLTTQSLILCGRCHFKDSCFMQENTHRHKDSQTNERVQCSLTHASSFFMSLVLTISRYPLLNLYSFCTHEG